MKIWCAFSATDINNDHKVNRTELKMLLWTYEESKPSDYRVKDVMGLIDSDHSGQVIMKEWLEYLCIQDEL